MGNRNNFKNVLERLLEAEQLLKIGIERGTLSSIERDILLEKLRSSYEQLLFDRPSGTPKAIIEEPASKVEPIKVETTQEIKSPPTPVEVPQVTKPKETPVQPVTRVEVSNKQVQVEAKKEEEVILEVTEEKEDTSAVTAEITIEEVSVTTTEIKSNQDNGERTILAEKFQGKKKFRNEVLGTGKKDVASVLQNKPISDLTKAIGINDKFLYTKELFEGNAELYATTIRKLNDYTDINDALIFIQENFSWDENNEAANRLIDLVRRKLLH